MGTEHEELEETGYGPDPEDPVTFDATDDAYGRGRLVLILAMVMVVAVIGIVYVAYQNGVRQGGRESPPIITADMGPSKVEPEDPGGLVVEHQDKLVYDRVSGEDRPQVEVLLPESEEPVDLSGLRTSDETETSVESEGLTQVPPPVIEDQPVVEPVMKPAIETEEVAGPPEKTVESLIIESAPQQTPAVTAPNAAAVSGSYVVQVGAFDGSELASTAWTTLRKKHGDLLADLRPDVQLADLGSKGIWYRLRIGPFDNKASAHSLCDKLKQRRQDCLVRQT